MQLTDIQQKFLNAYLEAILAANRSVNLTNITDINIAKVLHLEDSISALDMLDVCESGPYADLGCGGGFPGVPLGYLTKRETWLVDSRSKKIEQVKKCTVQAEKQTEIEHLTNFNFYAGRIEDFANEKRGYFSACSARALADTTILLELASPLLKVGGTLLCMKATPSYDEINNAKLIAPHLGFELAKTNKFSLSTGEGRQILAFVKSTEAEIKLPRRCGKAQKTPLTLKNF